MNNLVRRHSAKNQSVTALQDLDGVKPAGSYLTNQMMLCPQRSRQGFTLIELLVVMGITAVLAAILFPVFASAKRAAKKASCISNIGQVGKAIMLYAGDNDDHYMQGTDNNPGDAYGFGARVAWPDILQAYTKSAAVFRCPEYGSQAEQGKNRGLHFDLFPSNESIPYGAPVIPTYPTTLLENPADTIIMADKGANGASWSYAEFLTRQEWWAEGSIVDADGKIDPAKDNSRVSIRPNIDRDNAVGNTDWEGPRTVRYRNNAASCAFADGHVKAMVKGRIKFSEIYIEGPYQNTQRYLPAFQNFPAYPQ